MMKTSVSVLTLCIAVLVGGWTFAQEYEVRDKWLEIIERNETEARSMAESLPGELSDWIAMAKEHDPEIRRARAVVDTAQADLDEAMAKMTSLLRGSERRWEFDFRDFEEKAQVFERIRENADQAQVLRYARDTNHKLDSLRLQHFQITQMLGGERGGRPNRIAGPASMGGFAAFAQMRIPQPRPDFSEGTTENLRRTLENPVSCIFEDISVMEIFDFMSNTYEINITVDLAFTPPVIRQIELRNVPLRSVFLALADKMGDACFVIRDYGLFLTTRDRARTLAGPTIPEDVPYFAPMPMQGGFGGGGGGFGGGGGGFGFGGGFGGGGGGFGGGGFGARGPGAPNGGAATGDSSEAAPPPGKPDE